jgi:hypothetical protein
MKESRDQIQIGIAGLQTWDADPLRVERIRVRCLAVLEAQRRKERAERSGLADWRSWLEPTFALGLSALYLAAAVASTLALLR